MAQTFKTTLETLRGLLLVLNFGCLISSIRFGAIFVLFTFIIIFAIIS